MPKNLLKPSIIYQQMVCAFVISASVRGGNLETHVSVTNEVRTAEKLKEDLNFKYIHFTAYSDKTNGHYIALLGGFWRTVLDNSERQLVSNETTKGLKHMIETNVSSNS